MFLNKFFKLEENNTKVTQELLAGATTFFAMAYIIFVNPEILGNSFGAGMPQGAVFLATIFAIIIGTLIMGLFANVPYALAPGMGLNAFFSFTVCGAFGFSWQAALAMVFICGIINVIITVTKIRKQIIKAIPKSLQLAIGGGIGLFIAYIGVKNYLLSFNINNPADVIPGIMPFTSFDTILVLFGLVLTIVLLLVKVKGAILIGIVVSTIISIIYAAFNSTLNISFTSFAEPFNELGQTFGAAFGPLGMGSLFSDLAKLPMVLFAIFAFSLTDTFDTIGTFIGTGRKSGIFTDADIEAIDTSFGLHTKMEKALVADAVATSIGAIIGTSNTTTYVESAAGIESGGRTGLTSVFTALFFALCILLSPFIGLVPGSATAPALIIVGIMMASSLKGIDWEDFGEAVPAFFAVVLMPLAYNITTGIAFAFILYVIVKVCKKEIKQINPIMWVCSVLFILYFVFTALTTTV